MRRLIVGSLAFLAMTGTVLTLPVYAAPVPGAHPVETSIDEVQLGSVVQPEGEALVATDGVVQPDGVTESEVAGTSEAADSSATTDTPAPSSEPPAATGAPSSPSSPSSPSRPSTSAATDEDVPTSGDELPGVPALTVALEKTDPFSSVGVTWRADSSIVDVRVQVRVKDEDGDWGEWTPLEPDDIEQTASAETEDNDVRDGTAPYWTGPARGVEVIVQGAGGAVPEDVSLALLDPGTSKADALPTAGATDEAHAGTTMPDVVSRSQWGADDSIRTWDPEYAPTIKAATIHHTADGNNYTAAQVPAMMRSIYAYHTQTRGWGDIGYNVIVDKYGRIFEGRYGGLSSTVIGAHAGGFNTGTFGVSMLGNYAEVDTPQAMLDSVAAITAWKLSLYGVSPYGTTQLTSGGGGTSKYGAGAVVNLPTIFAHRDVGNTTCPGQYAYNRMGQIRDMVAARMAPTSGSPAGNPEVLSVTGNRLEVSGWAYDPEVPTTPISVGVSIDGWWSLSLPADRPRADVAAAYPALGAAHGFSGSTTMSVGKHTVCIVFVNAGPTGSNTWMKCQVVTATNISATRNPVGNLEAVTVSGRTITASGWSVDPDALSSSLDVHVYVNDRGTAALVADGRRDDVAAALPGAGSSHGFSWQTSVTAPGSYKVCVYAINKNDGTENPRLNCITVVVDSAQFEPLGHLDVATLGADGRTVVVEGWSLDRDVPTEALKVHLYGDGRYLTELTSSTNRPDVGALHAGAGAAHGFRGTVAFGPGAHTVCAFALNGGAGTVNPLLGCAPVTITSRAWEPVGNLDLAAPTGAGRVDVGGWAWDPDAGGSSSPVHIYVDGVYRQAPTAAGYRADVAAYLPAAGGGHGFATTLTLSPGRHDICAFGLNVGMGQYSQLLACRSVTT